MSVVHKIGRRKTAVARVYLREGYGKVTVMKSVVYLYVLMF
jgi:small subunit ribosomal protein S9